MASTWEELGPCTILVGPTPGGTDYAGEFLNVKIVHNYEEIGDAHTMLDGTKHGTSEVRTDGLIGDLENDLTDVGLYKFCYDNDLTETDVTVSQTVSGASWTGKVKVKLPAEIGADEFGAPVASSLEWTAVGVFAFTPAAATP